jgi:RNA polymerase sigma-70 factor (ECF subfamily)
MIVANDDMLTTRVARKAVAGDVAALAELVAKFSPALLALAHRRMSVRLAGKYTAEDLVADTWLTALRQLPDFDPQHGRVTPRLVGYLSTVLINRNNTLLQRHYLGEEPLGDQGELGQLGTRIPEPVSEVIRREEHAAVHHALEQLKAPDQEIVCLRGLQQLPHRTVATLMRMTPNTVRARYSRALRKLGGLLPDSLFPALLAAEDQRATGGAAAAH